MCRVVPGDGVCITTSRMCSNNSRPVVGELFPNSHFASVGAFRERVSFNVTTTATPILSLRTGHDDRDGRTIIHRVRYTLSIQLIDLDITVESKGETE